MIGYVTVGTNDLDRARSYYDALFGSIGGKRLMQLDDQRGFTMYGVAMNRPGVVVTRRMMAARRIPATATWWPSSWTIRRRSTPFTPRRSSSAARTGRPVSGATEVRILFRLFPRSRR